MDPAKMPMQRMRSLFPAPFHSCRKVTRGEQRPTCTATRPEHCRSIPCECLCHRNETSRGWTRQRCQCRECGRYSPLRSTAVAKSLAGNSDRHARQHGRNTAGPSPVSAFAIATKRAGDGPGKDANAENAVVIPRSVPQLSQSHSRGTATDMHGNTAGTLPVHPL